MGYTMRKGFHSFQASRWQAAFGALVAAVLLVVAPVHAAVPTQTAVEGVLLSAGGSPAADGGYQLTFALYAAASGGTALWSEGPIEVQVAGGRFHYALGASKPLDPKVLADAASLFLGAQVGSDPELPRQALRAVPYALVAASATGLTCTGCVAGDQIANGAIAAAKLGFNYAGSNTKGGPALDLACTGCVSVSEMKFDGDVDLGGNSLKAGSGTFTGDVVAKTVTATSFVGDGSKLTGLKTPAGTCKTGEVVVGIASDGSLQCKNAAASLPPDGLDEISNGLLANQFVDTIGATDKAVAIPDNTGASANSTLEFPDIGTAQAFSLTVEVKNTDLSTLAIVLLPPDDKKVGYVLCDPCGDKDTKAYKVEFPKTAPKSGDLTTWIGKNPKGTWNLKVTDTSFCIVQAPGNATLCDVTKKVDGEIVDWSITIQTLSNQKVQTKGQLLVDKSIRVGNDTIACTPATAGTIRWNGTSFQGCNGFKFFDIKLYVGPGSKAAPAGATCAEIKKTAADALDGVYWIDPDGGDTANAFQAYCDMTSFGGGWTLVLNLDTNDGSQRHYFDNTFWTGTGTAGAITAPLGADYKGEAFTAVAAKELMIKAHREGAQEGIAYYAFEAAYTGKTLHWLMNNVSNKTVTGKRLGANGSVGNAGHARNAGDSFIDHDHALILNSRYQPLDADNYTRIGTNYGSLCGVINCNGHNYAGLGGRHFRSGWGAYFEAAQVNGYCETQGVYGSDHSAYNGSNAASGCGYKTRDMDFAIWVR
ncbi:MAG: hypothetical protein RIT45_4112 [Pseudomonadota bacterium]|jgi:hypothetical protein